MESLSGDFVLVDKVAVVAVERNESKW